MLMDYPQNPWKYFLFVFIFKGSKTQALVFISSPYNLYFYLLPPVIVYTCFCLFININHINLYVLVLFD